MQIKYNIEIAAPALVDNFTRITNQIFALLPVREEGGDWEAPLSTLIEEIGGMNELILNYQNITFRLLCKLEGLRLLNEDKDFLLFRRTIFDCLNLVATLQKKCLA